MDERPQRSSWAFDLALCLLAPFFFLSMLFSALAPLPLLYIHQGNPDRPRARLLAFLSVLIGGILCAYLKGPGAALGFGLFAALPALLMGEILEKWRNPNRAVLGAVSGVCLALAVSAFFLAQSRGMDFLPFVRTTVIETVQTMSKKLLERPADLPQSITEEDLRQLIDKPELLLEEMPGILAAGLLLLCSISLVGMIRWNPKGFIRRLEIRRDFLRQWRAPEYLVWPTLGCATFLIFDVNLLSSFANNLLKPLLVIYFFQGMSILSFFLDVLRLKGPIRAILYFLGILFLTPMLISFGFFDLWFNFRGRMKEKESFKE